jgi:4-oxalocrotonate tautomerase
MIPLFQIISLFKYNSIFSRKNLLDGGKNMPVITVEGPKMSKDQKEKLVKAFAESASEVMGLPVEAMVIIIREVEAENVGVGNILLCNR